MNSKKYMRIALNLAKKAANNGDIPVGAIIVDQTGRIIGRGYNRKEKEQNPIKHAEIIAIVQACKKIGSWRLENCVIYSTLEPCLMCFGAIFQTRISKIVFGLTSDKFGSIRILERLKNNKNFNYSLNYSYQVTLESKEILQAFFSKLRSQNDMI